MTWKSYAAVSGATVLAGWFASTPPPNAPTHSTSGSASRSRAATSVSSDIEQQAVRLQSRGRADRPFPESERNPFRFESRAASHREAVIEPRSPEATAPAEAPRPMVSVSGIAEDQVDGRTERTAILSSPAGILLVHEGEEVLGRYRVVRIESEAVELVGLTTAETLRLPLGR